MPPYRAKREKGNAILEFGIIIRVLIPLMFGTVAFGVNLGNMLQSAQITRDIAHMYAKDVDFSTTANKNLAGVVIFSIGLGNSGTPPNADFLKRVANTTDASSYDSTKPAGFYVPVQTTDESGRRIFEGGVGSSAPFEVASRNVPPVFLSDPP